MPLPKFYNFQAKAKQERILYMYKNVVQMGQNV